MKRALLLDSDYRPLRFVSDVDAICMIYTGKASIVEYETGELSLWPQPHGLVGGNTFPCAATIRLTSQSSHFCKFTVGRFSRRVVFNRDKWKCQYCGCSVNQHSATIDHIHPASRGGRTSWMNCVTACKSCNGAKKNRTPEEADMSLLTLPRQPNPVDYWGVTDDIERHPDWSQFAYI